MALHSLKRDWRAIENRTKSHWRQSEELLKWQSHLSLKTKWREKDLLFIIFSMKLVDFLIVFWKEWFKDFLALIFGDCFFDGFQKDLRSGSSPTLILKNSRILKNIRVWDIDWKVRLLNLAFSIFLTQITRFFVIYLQMVLPRIGSSLFLLISTAWCSS